MFINIQDKTKLVKYVLHAMHKKIYAGGDKPEWYTQNEEGEWDLIYQAAKHFV